LLACSFASDAWFHPVSATDTDLRSNRFHDANIVRLKRSLIDTRARQDLDTARRDLERTTEALTSSATGPIKDIRIVQFAGTLKRRWIEELVTAGAEIVCFVPNNACIVRGDAKAIAALAALHRSDLADDTRPVQWLGRLEPVQKIDPFFSDQALARDNS